MNPFIYAKDGYVIAGDQKYTREQTKALIAKYEDLIDKLLDAQIEAREQNEVKDAA